MAYFKQYILALVFFAFQLQVNSQSYKLSNSELISTSKHQKIDDYSKRVPLFVGLSYKKLSKHLTNPYLTDEDKVRSISFWITQHIKYDFKKANKIKYKLQSPNKTILKRKGICGDYALLFDKLCEQAGIQSEIIDGYSKGFYFEPNDTLIRADHTHTWNAVLINNEWKLIDVLWMSGDAVIKKQLFRRFLYWSFKIEFTPKFKFEKNLNENFYLAQPDKFIETHLPLNSWWQLLNKPIPVEFFEENQLKVINSSEDTLVMYNYNDKIWQEINGESPDKFLVNGKKANQFNERNNKVLFDAYFNYSHQLVLKTSMSDLSNEDKIEVYNYAIDSLKLAKQYNKLYKKNISEEKKRRNLKNKILYTNLNQRNSDHINSDRKIKSKNYQLNDNLINIASKTINENHRLLAEQDRIQKQTINKPNSKKKLEDVNFELIKANNLRIEVLKDSILQLSLKNKHFREDSLNKIANSIYTTTSNIDSLISVSDDLINETCETRHVFNFDWYYANYIDSLETVLITHFKNKDAYFNLLHNSYLNYINISKELTLNNKKASKNYALILKLLKENEKNDFENNLYKGLFEELKTDWIGFNKEAVSKANAKTKLIRKYACP